jgi:hypothetical protein
MQQTLLVPALQVPVMGHWGMDPQVRGYAPTRPDETHNETNRIPAGSTNLSSFFIEHLRRVKVDLQFKSKLAPPASERAASEKPAPER